MATRLTPLMPMPARRWFRNTGSIATLRMTEDSLGVTWLMKEVRIGRLRRVIAVTSMKALYSCKFT